MRARRDTRLDFRGAAPIIAGVARVVIEHLTKVFPGPRGEAVRAVDDLSLAVEEGELIAWVGPSGCGKTTALRLIAGLEEPDGGGISLGGKPMARVPPRERDVAMVFQNHALYPHMSARENLGFGLKLRGCSKAEMAARVRETAEMLELTDCLDRRPAALSGGQRQRVALGRALARRPGLLLLDEPLSNLDAPMRLQMRAEIARLHRRLGITMIYVTHDQVEAMTLGRRIAVMKAGALQQVASPHDLYRHPANLFVAGFIGFPPINLFPGVLARRDNALFFEENPGQGDPMPGALALPLESETANCLSGYAGKPVLLGLRPEDVHECSGRPESPPAQTVQALLEAVEPMGAETHLRLTRGGRHFIARAASGTEHGVNQKLSLIFDMRQAYFFDPETEKAL